jgi:hypothetical protein
MSVVASFLLAGAAFQTNLVRAAEAWQFVDVGHASTPGCLPRVGVLDFGYP